jgi:hypothetical protein
VNRFPVTYLVNAWHAARVKRSYRRQSSALSAVALLFVLACGKIEPQFPVYSPYDGDPNLLTPEDAAVYDVVLPAVERIFEVHPPPPPPPPPGSYTVERTVVTTPPLASTVPLEPITRRTNVEPQSLGWREVNGENISPPAVPRSAVLDFQHRNERRASLKRLHPNHVRIIWFEGERLIGRATYSLTLPGYSPDHDEALVEVSDVDSPMSGGGELVYLRKVGGVWRIIAKQRTWIS